MSKNFLNIFKDKNTLITGGTGSFGNAVVKLINSELKEIRIYSRWERYGLKRICYSIILSTNL